MRWGEKETCIFSKIYIGHQCLWNPEHSFYKMREKRTHAYREIMAEFYDATEIKLNEIEVKMKIKNLRSTYLQELHKIKQRSNEEWTYRPNMKWFHDWYKCLSTIKKGDSVLTSFDVSREYTNNIDADDTCGEMWMSQDEVTPDLNNSNPAPDDDYKLLLLKPEPSDTSTEHRPRPHYKVKKKKVKRRHTSTDESEKFDNYRILDTNTDVEDEFDIYGKYIATQLRKMELQKALRVQIEIQSIVSEARISDLSDK